MRHAGGPGDGTPYEVHRVVSTPGRVGDQPQEMGSVGMVRVDLKHLAVDRFRTRQIPAPVVPDRLL